MREVRRGLASKCSSSSRRADPVEQANGSIQARAKDPSDQAGFGGTSSTTDAVPSSRNPSTSSTNACGSSKRVPGSRPATRRNSLSPWTRPSIHRAQTSCPPRLPPISTLATWSLPCVEAIGMRFVDMSRSVCELDKRRLHARPYRNRTLGRSVLVRAVHRTRSHPMRSSPSTMTVTMTPAAVIRDVPAQSRACSSVSNSRLTSSRRIAALAPNPSPVRMRTVVEPSPRLVTL